MLMAMRYLDRVLKGIGKGNGRVQWNFCTDDPKTQNAMKVMVDSLYKTGQHHFLKAVEDKQLDLMKLYVAWSSQSLNKLPIGGAIQFDPTVFEWLKTHTLVEKSRKNYEEYYKALLKVRKSFTLEELPSVLKEYKKRCEKKDTARMFNATRNACRAFLKHYFEDKFNPIYLQVMNIIPMVEKEKNQGKSWTVAEVDGFLVQMPWHVREQFWTMCITGIGMEEYRQGLTVENKKAIHIAGQKMKRLDDRRNRRVPFIQEPSRMHLEVQQFRRLLKGASDGKLKVSDARKCYSRWLQEAGVIYDHRMQYMGHAPQTMSDRYSRTECEQLWEEDAKKLTDYIKNEREKAKQKVEQQVDLIKAA
jgi:hypothetical protein